MCFTVLHKTIIYSGDSAVVEGQLSRPVRVLRVAQRAPLDSCGKFLGMGVSRQAAKAGAVLSVADVEFTDVDGLSKAIFDHVKVGRETCAF